MVEAVADLHYLQRHRPYHVVDRVVDITAKVKVKQRTRSDRKFNRMVGQLPNH